jgi:hypothetical protein
MPQITSHSVYMPAPRNGYVLEARSQLQKLAIGGAVVLTLGAIFGPPGLVKAGAALGAAGLVGLVVLAALEQ